MVYCRVGVYKATQDLHKALQIADFQTYSQIINHISVALYKSRITQSCVHKTTQDITDYKPKVKYSVMC